jgi:hypothetical protein
MAKDIFDLILPDENDEPKITALMETGDPDVSQVKSEIEKLNRKLTAMADEKKKQKEKLASDIRDLIKSEVAKLRPVENVVERTLEKQVVKNIHVPVHVEPRVVQAPPQIIREVRVEVPAKDTRVHVEQSAIDALNKQIADLKKELAKTKELAERPVYIPGGSGVIGIPNPTGTPENYVLTIERGQAKWKVATAAGGGSSSDAYTVSNGTTDRAFDVSNTSIDELAAVLGSLIASLQGAGIIQ